MSDKLPPKILVVESDEVLNTSLCNTIERYWFDVNRARSSETAIRSVEIDPPNVIIISSRLKDSSAAELAIQIKKLKGGEGLPIIFLIEPDEKVENYVLAGGEYFAQSPASSYEDNTDVFCECIRQWY